MATTQIDNVDDLVSLNSDVKLASQSRWHRYGHLVLALLLLWPLQQLQQHVLADYHHQEAYSWTTTTCMQLALLLLLVNALWFGFAPLVHYIPLRPFRKRAHLPNQQVPASWYKACASRDLPMAARKSFIIAGREIVIVRTEANNGAAVVFDAHCPHIGAHLGIEPTTVDIEDLHSTSPCKRVDAKKSTIECPYHCWRFSVKTGLPVDMGEAKSKPMNTKETPKLRLWRVQELAQTVFVWYPPEREPTWLMSDSTSIPKCLDDPNSCYFVGTTEAWVQCRLAEIPENAPDKYHLKPVHAASMLPRVFPMLEHCYENARWFPSDKHTFQAQLDVGLSLTLFGRKLSYPRMQTRVIQIGLGFVYFDIEIDLGFGFGCCSRKTKRKKDDDDKDDKKWVLHMLQSVTPITNNLNRIQHVGYANRGIPMWFSKAILWALAEQSGRDVPIWHGKQYLDNPGLCQAEQPILDFREWAKQFSWSSDESKQSKQRGHIQIVDLGLCRRE
jgi:3-ketosteroid 9alpha-monooxygenase subunit A